MHTKIVREFAKFASGLIMGDFIYGIWLYTTKAFPLAVFGITFTERVILGWLLFDLVLFVFLVYYGWHNYNRSKTRMERTFHRLAGIVFAIVAIAHLSRILFGWHIIIGTWDIPYWINGLGAVIAGFLAYISFHTAKKR